VDPRTEEEVAHHTGFGDFPGGIAAAEGRVLVSLYGTGILEWDAGSGTLVRGLDDPLTPGAIPPVADLGFDAVGRLFALNPGSCAEPGAAYRLDADGAVTMEAATGICPIALGFTTLPGS
jgi:hypothetical protein